MGRRDKNKITFIAKLIILSLKKIALGQFNNNGYNPMHDYLQLGPTEINVTSK